MQNATWDGPNLHQGRHSSGNGYLDFRHSRGDWIEWKFSSIKAGPAKVGIVYACSNNRPLELKVNGEVLESSLDFPRTPSWSDWQTLEVEVPLVEGVNTVRITAIGHSGGNFDALVTRGLGS